MAPVDVAEGSVTQLNQCSFCGRSEDQVKKLIAGADAFICDQCVALCSEVLATGRTKLPGAGTSPERTGRDGWSGQDPVPQDKP